MALQLDPSSGLPLDPATLQALQEQQLSRDIAGGGAASRMNEMTVGRGINTMFPNLQMRQAQAADQAMRGLNIAPQGDGESDIDFQLRTLRGQQGAIASVDPRAAMGLNDRIAKLAEMKFQNARLTAEDQRQQATFDANAPERAAAGAVGGYAYLGKVDKDGQLLSSSVFDATNSAEAADAQRQMKADPSLRIFSQKDIANLTKSEDSASRKLAQSLLLQQMKDKAGLIPDETVPQFAFDSTINPTLLSRLSPGAKAQLEQFYNKVGMSTADQGSIRAEYKGMMAAVGVASKREANMNLFTNELQQQQGVLLDTQSGLDRGRVAYINKLWSQGQTYFGDNKQEAAYAAALQTYVNTYARVVGGGTGVVSDNARKEALAALSGGYLGPQGMKGATDMLSQKEAAIVNNASDATVELFSNPSKYKHLLAWQDRARKLGYNVAATSTEDSALDAKSPPAAAPPQPPPGAAPQQTGLPAGWSVQAH